MNRKLLNRVLLYASGILAVAAIILLVIALVSDTESPAILPGGLACSALSGTLSMLQRRKS